LTGDQQRELNALQREVDTPIVQTLNDDQKKKLNPSGVGPASFAPPGQILSTSMQIQLKPTSEQKQALGNLQKKVDAGLDKLLSDDQKKQLKQMKEDFARGGGPGGPRGPGGPGGPPPGMFAGPPGGASLFRAYKYAADYPGLSGRDLTPGQTVEEIEKTEPKTKKAEP
jgi:hypothetical protein